MKVLRGIDMPPVVVAVARGVLEAAVMGALVALVSAVGAFDWGDKAYLVPVALLGLRTVEGFADHIDPAKTRKPDA